MLYVTEDEKEFVGFEEAVALCSKVIHIMEGWTLLENQRSTEEWENFLQGLFQSRDKNKK